MAFSNFFGAYSDIRDNISEAWPLVKAWLGHGFPDEGSMASYIDQAPNLVGDVADRVGVTQDDLDRYGIAADASLPLGDQFAEFAEGDKMADYNLLDYLQGLMTSSGLEAAITRSFNANEAEKSRNWQEYMSNTAYQRGVADLKAAGLNPILAASKGFAATTPSGATATSSPARGDTMADILSILGGTISDILKVLTK